MWRSKEVCQRLWTTHRGLRVTKGTGVCRQITAEPAPLADICRLTTKKAVTLQPREPRRSAVLPVRITGKSSDGTQFDTLGYTLDISTKGVRIAGVRSPVTVGEKVEIQCHQEKGHFQVIWTRQMQETNEWQVGLRCMDAKGGFRCWR